MILRDETAVRALFETGRNGERHRFRHRLRVNYHAGVR